MQSTALDEDSLIPEYINEITFEMYSTNQTYAFIYEGPHLIYDDTMVYPVIKNKPGVLHENTVEELKVRFNCLGIKGSTIITLQVDIIGFKPLQIYIGKKCGIGKLMNYDIDSWIGKLEEAIASEEERYGFIKAFVIIILFILSSIALIKGVSFVFGIPKEKQTPTQDTTNDPSEIELKVFFGLVLENK